MQVLLALVVALVVLVPGRAGAEALVLVQGYLGEGGDWVDSGVAGYLERAGWIHGGHLRMHPAGTAGMGPGTGGPRRFYTVELPTEAPLMVQADVLGRYVTEIRRHHGDETLVLVGHSAGGVLARAYMVHNPTTGVDALVTIASPHLGTGTAEIGALAGQTPLGWFAPFVGGSTLNRSQGLYRDLVRERPNTFLYWLNRQPHPEARYVSVVRKGEDALVPAWSQDMNAVYALKGRAWRVEHGDAHSLDPADGALIVRILGALQRS